MIKCFDSDISVKEKQALDDIINTRVLAFGPKVQEFEKRYKTYSKKSFNIGFNSASSAAYLLYQYFLNKFGSCRVYTTSLGFVSPVTAALKNKHEVVYVDVDENLLMSCDDLRDKFIDDGKTSIIMPVLYGGVSTISGFEQFCKSNKSILVLDSAHCISPTMDYDYAFYSFHPVKPICMSNGGLLSTDDEHAAEFMFSGRNFGRVIMGDTYDLAQVGFNFYMNNLNAALGLVQLEKCENNVQKRKDNFNFLKQNLPSNLGYLTEHDAGSSYYLSSLILKKSFSSGNMRKYLGDKGIQSSFHYPFLHTSSFYKDGSTLQKLDEFKDRIINLPIHQNLEKQDLEKILDECIRYSRGGS